MKTTPMRRTHRIFSIYALSIALLLAQGLASYGQSRGTVPPFTIENFGKLNDSYYRGSQPLADQFTQLKKLGIKTVIDLREDSVEQADDWARAAGLQYNQYSINN